jgi:GT2 family glycosyltransferase
VTAPRASIIVPTFQRRERLLDLLRALGRQTTDPATFEVIVVVDGSTDGSAAAAAAVTVPFRLRVIEQPNAGRASAVNAGCRDAAGDLVLLLDDDMVPAADWLARHVLAHDGLPRAAVMGAVPMETPSDAAPAARYVARRFNRHLQAIARPGYRLLLTDFYSGNLSIARRDLAAVGGFDEAFRRYGNEDLELSVRLKAAGVALRYDASAAATQFNDKDFPALARDNTDEGRTAVLFATKHPALVGDMRVGQYGRGPRLMRGLRDRVLARARRRPSTLDGVIELERRLARRRLTTARFYRFALNLFFWTGVADALRDCRASGRLDGALVRLAREMDV